MKRELKHTTKLAKICYKNKMEERFTRGNAREAWQGLNMQPRLRGKDIPWSLVFPAPCRHMTPAVWRKTPEKTRKEMR
ncbi:hypothetical protein SKAU_G00020590 [Synaphobranchus kaupii]|uniref:Uncharacterized protein n=1 Tax=Synaphobranchus kaupii TaxID=118154 RepID=A0A9Q1JC58_SYNKA|nr:hypothetical protein SKAU_G00020590 [Synaphobranchus kaupii]